MNPWQWIWEFRERAEQSQDFERLRLLHIYASAHAISHDLPAQRLQQFENGRELATRLGETWWALYFEHWVVETLLYGTQQPSLALDRAVRAVFEVRKSIYDGFPQRVHLHLNLVGAYLSVDPIGYETKLREVLDYVELECEISPDIKAYFAQLKGYFLEAVGDPEALEMAWEYLRRAEEAQSEHFLWDSLYMLSSTLYRFDPVSAHFNLGAIARLGEDVARREDRNRGVAAFMMWQALVARWEGHEALATDFYQRAVELQTKVPPPRNDIHFAAMAYHRDGKELRQALEVCQASIRVLRRHGLKFLEAQRRLEKCRLLRDMGVDWMAEEKRLLRLGSSLVSKPHWERQLKALKGGAL